VGRGEPGVPAPGVAGVRCWCAGRCAGPDPLRCQPRRACRRPAHGRGGRAGDGVQHRARGGGGAAGRDLVHGRHRGQGTGRAGDHAGCVPRAPSTEAPLSRRSCAGPEQRLPGPAQAAALGPMLCARAPSSNPAFRLALAGRGAARGRATRVPREGRASGQRPR